MSATDPDPEPDDPSEALPAPVAEAVESLVGKRYGPAIRVVGRETLSTGRSTVERLTLDGPRPAAPASVVLKYGDNAELLRNEWIGLSHVTDVSAARPGGLPVPRLVGGATLQDGRIVVLLEDFGPGRSLADVFLSGTAAEAEAGLRGYVDALLAIHLATFGRAEEFASVRQERLEADEIDLEQDPVRPRWLADRAWPAFADAVAELDATLPVRRAEVVEAVEWIDGTLAGPGPWWAFSPNDCCPDNNWLPNRDADGNWLPNRDADDNWLPSSDTSELRLFDLEFCNYRHALLDLAYLHSTMPTCWCVRRMPLAIADGLVERYRAGLGARRPDLAGSGFERELAACQAYWPIWSLGFHFARSLGEQGDERHHVERLDFSLPSSRQTVEFRLEQLIAASGRTPELSALGSLAYALRDRLRALRPGPEPLPLYPAFGPVQPTP